MLYRTVCDAACLSWCVCCVAVLCGYYVELRCALLSAHEHSDHV
jgi:hypothetical protein